MIQSLWGKKKKVFDSRIVPMQILIQTKDVLCFNRKMDCEVFGTKLQLTSTSALVWDSLLFSIFVLLEYALYLKTCK